jgi:glucan 1,3-beta-glucosidase
MITENGKTLASYSDNINVFPDTIALFTTGAVVVPPTNPSLLGWNYRGCYTDAAARTLGNFVQVTGGAAAMTVEACITACQAAGYSIVGVEYSQECCKCQTPIPLDYHSYVAGCDNALHNGGGPAPDGNLQCNMACNGNKAGEICGGGWRLSLYSYLTCNSTTLASSGNAKGKLVDAARPDL